VDRIWASRCKGVYVPLVDMQVGRHVGGQARGRRGPSHWLVRKVVHARPLHAHVPEVEALGAQAVCAKQRSRRRQVAAVSPWARYRWRAHGRERRGHFHDCGVSVCLLCRATCAITIVCGPSTSLSGGRCADSGGRYVGDKHTIRQES